MVQRNQTGLENKIGRWTEFSTFLSDREDPAFGATSLATRGADLTSLSHSTAMVAWFCSSCLSFENVRLLWLPKTAKPQSVRVDSFINHIKFFVGLNLNLFPETSRLAIFQPPAGRCF